MNLTQRIQYWTKMTEHQRHPDNLPSVAGWQAEDHVVVNDIGQKRVGRIVSDLIHYDGLHPELNAMLDELMLSLMPKPKATMSDLQRLKEHFNG